MWSLYLTAKTTSTRPSDLLDVSERWAAYQFDTAVTTVGRVIENAMAERVEVGIGDKKEWKPKYMLVQILDDDFRLEVEEEPTEHDKQLAGWNALKAWAGKSSRVKVIKLSKGDPGPLG